jgi:ankyrin repeat protein
MKLKQFRVSRPIRFLLKWTLITLGLMGATWAYVFWYHNYALGVAVRDGDIAMVRAQLQNGANPNASISMRNAEDDDMEYDVVLLEAAIEAKRSDIVAVLVEHGANLSPTFKEVYDTPLIYASERGDASCVRVLLDHGADVQERDQWGKTALMFARDAAIAEELIAHGADVNAVDTDGYTVLMHRTGNSDIVQILCSHHVPINARNKYEQTALQLARINEASYSKDAENKQANEAYQTEVQNGLQDIRDSIRILKQYGAKE